MYEETGCFDLNSMAEGADYGFSHSVPNSNNTSDELSYPRQLHKNTSAHVLEDVAVIAMELELQKHLAFNAENCHSNTNLFHDPNQLPRYDQSDWDTGVHHDEMGFNHHHQDDPQQNGHQSLNNDISSSLQDNSYAQTPDLINLLHLPRCTTSSLLPDSSIYFTNPNHRSSLGYTGGLPASDVPPVLYDPLFHSNLPPQPPLIRELFQSIPHGYSFPGSRGGANSLLGDEKDTSGVLYEDAVGGHFDNAVLEFTRDMACISRGREGCKTTKHCTTERQRREQMNNRFDSLRSLIPNPTKIFNNFPMYTPKNDRASVVGDAIEYIKELLRTVNELKLLVEKKRCARERIKRRKTEDDEGCDIKPLVHPDQSYNPSLRSSWLRRKSKDTEVDVRIIDDDVTIKLVQRKKIDCLLFVSKVLDELHLDLHHVAGGHIGDFYSFLFNTKIYEGSSVYAGAIANKLIEVMDREYAAVAPTSCSY